VLRRPELPGHAYRTDEREDARHAASRSPMVAALSRSVVQLASDALVPPFARRATRRAEAVRAWPIT
jgi:hypothetical protein